MRAWTPAARAARGSRPFRAARVATAKKPGVSISPGTVRSTPRLAAPSRATISKLSMWPRGYPRTTHAHFDSSMLTWARTLPRVPAGGPVTISKHGGGRRRESEQEPQPQEEVVASRPKRPVLDDRQLARELPEDSGAQLRPPGPQDPPPQAGRDDEAG